jgi:hypothetical protein
MNTNDPEFEVLVRDQHILSLKAEIVRLEAERDVLKPKGKVIDLLASIDGGRWLMDATSHLQEHVEDYEGPCLCETCRSYGD